MTNNITTVAEQVAERAARLIIRESTDFLGRIDIEVVKIDKVFDQYEGEDLDLEAMQQLDEAFLELSALALAQLALLRADLIK